MEKTEKAQKNFFFMNKVSLATSLTGVVIFYAVLWLLGFPQYINPEGVAALLTAILYFCCIAVPNKVVLTTINAVLWLGIAIVLGLSWFWLAAILLITVFTCSYWVEKNTLNMSLLTVLIVSVLLAIMYGLSCLGFWVAGQF